MIVCRSRLLHLIALANGNELCLHAVTQDRFVVSGGVAELIRFFDEPRDAEACSARLAAAIGVSKEDVRTCIDALVARGALVRGTPDEEAAELSSRFAPLYGRDPLQIVDQMRASLPERRHEYWSVSAPRDAADFRPCRHRLDVVLLGDCDVQMEADFLRREGRANDIDIRVSAVFEDEFAADTAPRHDAVILGALRSRHTVALGKPDDFEGGDPSLLFLFEARSLVERLRTFTSAPILIDNLPVPTVSPLGLADRGPHSHRNRFRRANLGLAALAEELPDVFVADIEAVLAYEGKRLLLDDALVGFTHFGSLGWMLQRPEDEKTATHGLFPSTEALIEAVEGDPYRRETFVAREHVALLMSLFNVDRKKCVVVDLDGTLWAGALAETGAPFAWHPDVSSPYSYAGLYFGLHEALKALHGRGILLACVSKNDESVVRELWQYEDEYPRERLLMPGDFVAMRINWNDKAENIESIAAELGLAIDSFAFIDDNPIERERVRTALPGVLVLGENPFALRRILLSDPRFQPPTITEESSRRRELVSAHLERNRMLASAPDREAFLAGLCIECDVRRVSEGDDLRRLSELFDRTTQFTTTDERFTPSGLEEIMCDPRGGVFSMRVRDRFGDHGIVGACAVSDGEIRRLALSCRVIGLGVEHVFLDQILAALGEWNVVTARLQHTPRNTPARDLYREHGFSSDGNGRWNLDASRRLEWPVNASIEGRH